MLTKRFGGAAAGFIGGGLLSMILLALIVSTFDLAFQSVMPAALVVGSICGVVGFCFPGLGASLFAKVDW
jgi:hypothetical protein